MATTTDVTLTATWTKIADAGEEFTASFPAAAWRYAVVATDTTPTVQGHRVVSEGALTRAVALDGYVFARADPPTSAVVGAVTK